MRLLQMLPVATVSAPEIDYVNDTVVSEIGGLVTTIFGWVTANPILTIFLTMSMISIGFVLIGWLKGVVKLH